MIKPDIIYVQDCVDPEHPAMALYKECEGRYENIRFLIKAALAIEDYSYTDYLKLETERSYLLDWMADLRLQMHLNTAYQN